MSYILIDYISIYRKPEMTAPIISIAEYESRGWRLSEGTKTRRKNLHSSIKRHEKLSKETLAYLDRDNINSIYHQLEIVNNALGRKRGDEWVWVDEGRNDPCEIE